MNITDFREMSLSYMTKYKFFFPAIGLISVYLLPYYLFGTKVPVVIHDNLDYSVIMFKILAESGKMFAAPETVIPNAMSGLPRVSYHSEWNVIILLYVLFEPFVAYILNITIIHLIAFFGMYYLLNSHFVIQKNELITISVATCFALLPFWSAGGLTIAGQPLALYAFLNLRKRSTTQKDWLILAFLPFYSSFVLGFVFFLGIMGILWLYDIFRTKKINSSMFLGLTLMTGLFLLIEYRLVVSMFLNTGFVSNRIEYNAMGLNIGEIIQSIRRNFIYGQYHAASFQTYFVLFAMILALGIIIYKRLMKEKEIILLVVGVVCIAVWKGIIESVFWQPIRLSLTFLTTFKIERFYFLAPIIWYLIFALALRIIYQYSNTKQYNIGRLLVSCLILSQVLFLFLGNGGHPSYIQFYNAKPDAITYEQFFAEKQFEKIKADIGLPQESYRVVSIGMHPSIALYNGFYTLDGYNSNYPLEYKHAFRNIIAQELEKREDLRLYFDNFGSRCYIMVAELNGWEYTKERNVIVNNLELNATALQNMGCKYVFSAVEIFNHADNNLTLINIYESDISAWRIHLYQNH